MTKPISKSPPREPSHFLFIVTSVEWEPHTTGREIVDALARRNIWLASSLMPYRREYKLGDRVLLYVAGKGARYLVGDAVIAGPISPATPAEAALARQLGLEGYDDRIPLEAVHLWERPISLKPLVPQLQFIKDKKYWGLHLRLAAARLPREDFELILREANIVRSEAKGQT